MKNPMQPIQRFHPLPHFVSIDVHVPVVSCQFGACGHGDAIPSRTKEDIASLDERNDETLQDAPPEAGFG